MPVVGDIITSEMARAATRELASTFGHLRSVAKGAKARGLDVRSRDVQLRELAPEEVARAWQVIRPPLVWKADDNCGPRAIVAAHSVNRALGSGVTGIDDALAMAVGVQPHRFGRVGTTGEYQYHAFPVVRAKGHDELLALDPRNFDGPVPLSQMRSHINGRVPAEVWSPIQNYGFEFSTLLEPLRRRSFQPVFSIYERYLAETWARSARAGQA